MTEIQVFRRRISAEQRSRRDHILEQAIVLISEEGGAVAMETIANAAEVSRTTLYRYYTTKEHLLAEMTLKLGQDFLDDLTTLPPPGHTVGEKVQAMCQNLTSIGPAQGRLLGACVNNLSSNDPAVLDSFEQLQELVMQMFTTLLRQSVPSRWLNVEDVLFRYLFGSLVLATSGKITYQALADDLTALCRSLLNEAWWEPA